MVSRIMEGFKLGSGKGRDGSNLVGRVGHGERGTAVVWVLSR